MRREIGLKSSTGTAPEWASSTAVPPQRLTECHQPGEGNAQAVIARADEARCRATDDGRNSVRIADKVTLIADETYRHNRVS